MSSPAFLGLHLGVGSAILLFLGREEIFGLISWRKLVLISERENKNGMKMGELKSWLGVRN